MNILKIRNSLPLMLVATLGFQGMASEACCSLYPAHFSDTVIYAGEAVRDGVPVHVLGYQNTAENRSVKSGGNAMLLPIPAKTGTMTAANILDTSKCKEILQDMKRAVVSKQQYGRALGATRGVFIGNAIPKVQVFEHDIYTIVLAQDADSIPAALNQVPQDRRPSLNKEIFSAYSKWYPDYTFALCCFNTKDQARANPMLWWYEPLTPDELFCPALDAHDGKAPRLGVSVAVDHVLVAGSHLLKHPMENKNPSDLSGEEMAQFAATDVTKMVYSDKPLDPEVRKVLPKCIVGEIPKGFQTNGDFVFRTSDVREGIVKVIRKSPPGAAKP